MKATDYIAETLSRRGVRSVFEVSGGMITHLLDSLNREGTIRVVSVHHEQAAAFAADGVGRMTGTPGVALATSGPGATNLLTGMGSCYFDSSPAIFITGQVNRDEQKGDRKIRQLGFQETDIATMATPITKAVWKVTEATELPRMLDDAFTTAVTGRPGPVLLDIPMDVQRNAVPAEYSAPPSRPARKFPDRAAVADAIRRLAAARRPLILVGGGIRSGLATPLFRQLASLLAIPVVHSLMGVDILPSDNPLRVGMIGTYGNRWANVALGNSDFVLVLGSRLDVRQTGADTAAFMAGRSVVHVDCEPGEMNNRVTGCTAIESDLSEFLTIAIEEAGHSLVQHDAHPEWSDQIAAWRTQWPDTSEQPGLKGINPNVLMHELSARSAAAAAYVVDVGNHQMWAAQSLDLNEDQRFLTSGGMGSMGFALPASIGAAVCTGKPVVVVAGDGGFQCNLQELQTVVRNRLPVKIVIINNKCHGMVRQFQESYFEGRYQSTLWGYDAPDFAAVAKAYGIHAATIDSPENTAAGLAELWRDPEAPALLQVMVETYVNAYPKIAFGHPITEMEPFAKPIAMEST